MLIDRLRILKKRADAKPAPMPYVHKQETAEELYDMVALACENRALAGCSTIRFHWDYVYTNDRDLYNEQHEVCLKVVNMLKADGLKASCENSFPEPFLNVYDEMEHPEGHHYIEASWDHPWFPYMKENDE